MFRTFRRLRVERLGQVNLITGKNNVGKSCFLEALWLYASKGSPRAAIRLLRMRDEVRPRVRRTPLHPEASYEEQRALNVRFLFHGRNSVEEGSELIRLGPVDKPDREVTLGVGWATWSSTESGGRRFRLLGGDEYRTAESPTLVFISTYGSAPSHLTPVDQYYRGYWPTEEASTPTGFFVPANGLEAATIGPLWDSVALSPLEDDVLASLRIICPNVERLALIGEPEPLGTRIPVVRLSGTPLAVPLRSVGEGMNRLFGIALALVNAKGGILLVDEIESGIHYAVQADLWRMVFTLADRFGIQVFATTHSWDCISGFQEAASEHTGRAMLIRLSEHDGSVVATLFDQDDLAIATRENIEVR